MTSLFKGAVARAATAPVLAAALTFGALGAAPAAHAADSVATTSTSTVAPAAPTTTAPVPLTAAQKKAAAKKRKALAKKRARARAALRLKKRTKKVLSAARSRQGARYVYGATGPWTFDCSGFTGWVYKRAGKSLPRTSGAQVGATKRLSRAAARPGDLVFFHRGGRVYHVGIYAGGNSLYHASRPGTPVGKGAIWTSSVFFGRVR